MAARKMKREPKNERAGRGIEVSFLSSPSTRSLTRPIFRAVIDSLSSFFAPKPHRTLATQARVFVLAARKMELVPFFASFFFAPKLQGNARYTGLNMKYKPS